MSARCHGAARTIDLSPEAKALIGQLIETRGYRDPEQVLAEALRVLAKGEPSIEDDDRALLREP